MSRLNNLKSLELNLHENSIESEGSKYLAEGLAKLTCLESLTLSLASNKMS